MDDKTLIKKLAEGDVTAVRLLVENNKNLIWHIIISMAGRNSDSEDLFQEVFLRVFKGIKKFRGEASLSTWIGSITHHVCIDYIRKKKKNMNLRSRDDEQHPVTINTEDKNWKQPDNKDIHRLVLATIEELPADYRTVITLYHLDERPYREIAEITGMPEGTVKSYINRGRTLLRKKLLTLVPDLTEIMDDF